MRYRVRRPEEEESVLIWQICVKRNSSTTQTDFWEIVFISTANLWRHLWNTCYVNTCVMAQGSWHEGLLSSHGLPQLLGTERDLPRAQAARFSCLCTASPLVWASGVHLGCILVAQLPVSHGKWHPSAVRRYYLASGVGRRGTADSLQLAASTDVCAVVGSGADNVFGNRANCSVSREWWQNKNQF